uniref:Polyketide synthase 20 n=1 Tax=Diaporthe helianthi TaxID=158607 RepID=A0A1I9KHW4_DIAHE|nr:polyketide synthase 20 [Diaporthe helianthi]
MVSEEIGRAGPAQVSVEDVAGDMKRNLRSDDPTKTPSGRFVDSKIAIVGFSGRFPSADSNEAFWDLLRAGRDVHREIPPDRFNWKSHYDATGKAKNTSRVNYGCFIDEPGNFDARFFNMSPREAENTDPAQRLAITTTYEAMEMAGMVRNRTPSTQQDRVGVFFGTTSDGLDRGHFLSTTGNCNAFDDSANGYCRADAVGSVILKRLEDAEADSDPILGVIVGSTTNHCGQTDSITRPHEGDKSSVFRRIMRYTNYDPLDIGYIEMHGTGTQAGDATEMRSVLSVFASDHKRTSQAVTRPLYLGSAKANIGHAESASGVSSLIKVLMMMRRNEIPPHCGIKTRINHNYPGDLAERGVNIASQPTPWRREDTCSGKRACFLNNFSAAGGNTAVLLEDAPTRGHQQSNTDIADARPIHLVCCTGRSAKSMLDNTKALVSWLENNTSSISELPALSYTTTARRMHHNYRTIVSGSSIDSIMTGLKTRVAQSEATHPKPVPAHTPKIVFTFTGQGGIYNMMGKPLFDCNSRFRESIVRFDHLAKVHGFPSFIGIIDGTHSGSMKDASPVVQQLSMTCLQMALTELLVSWGVKPSAVIGHSLGEYAGLHAAGVLSTSDVIYLVGTRATLLERHCQQGTHAMLAVRAPINVVNGLLSSPGCGCELACLNQPTGHVIAGPLDKISDLQVRAKAMSIETCRLNVPYAFHSPQVEPILDEYLKLSSRNVIYRPPAVPVISPLTARTVSGGDENQIVWLEIGPNPACGGMIKGTLGSDTTTLATLRENTDGFSPLATMLESLYLSGIEIDWTEYHRDCPNSHHVLELPRYSWDLKRYWIDYRNDFCLLKGEKPDDSNFSSTVVSNQITQFMFLSPAVQKVIEESHGTETSTVITESDIFDARLLPVLQGHLVNSAALCPSSLYADIALTIAHFMVAESGHAVESIGFDVSAMKVEAPLIALPGKKTHSFRVNAEADWHSNQIRMSLGTVNETGKVVRRHATFVVLLTPAQTWAHEWKRLAHLVQGRVESLARGVASGSCHHIKRGMAYKLFSALVDYGKEYQGMNDVIIDSDQLEAVPTVEFQVGSEGFHLNPRWIDSLGHIAGFIMNANDSLANKSTVFVNHGWDHMRIAGSMEAGKTYQVYNRMQLAEKNLYAGDTYIFDSGQIIAVFEGVTLSSSSGIMHRLLAIVGEEVGIPPSELTGDTEFSEVGIDSPLSLTMTARFQEELNLDLPSSVFVENPTIGALQRLVRGEALTESNILSSGEPEKHDALIEVDTSSSEDTRFDFDSATDSASSSTPPLSSVATTPGVPTKWNMAVDTSIAANGSNEMVDLTPYATSTLLSSPGAAPRAEHLLFLYPDGSGSAGSAASYASLASYVGNDTAVYGLNCPWRKDAEDMTRLGVHMDLIAAKFLVETTRIIRQKPGIPFSLGGWSAGGIIACEVARQLGHIQDLPQPERLILIDSPNPIGLQNPPQRLYDFFDSIGVFGTTPGEMPAWLRQQFTAFIRVLDEYKPRPLFHAPPTLIIYARDGVCKDPNGPKIDTHPDDPREMRWLLNDRTDFSGDGWATLLGRDNIRVVTIDDVNHFSMMDKGCKSAEIGNITSRFLSEALR